MGKRGKTGEHANHPKREKSNFWKGGIHFSNGYKHIYFPGHKMSDKKGYIPEHRLVMFKHIGRFLKTKEIVHHKNGIKTDNRIKNLIITTRQNHILDHLPIQFRKNFKFFVKIAICKGCKIKFKPKRNPRFKNVFCSLNCWIMNH